MRFHSDQAVAPLKPRDLAGKMAKLLGFHSDQAVAPLKPQDPRRTMYAYSAFPQRSSSLSAHPGFVFTEFRAACVTSRAARGVAVVMSKTSRRCIDRRRGALCSPLRKARGVEKKLGTASTSQLLRRLSYDAPLAASLSGLFFAAIEKLTFILNCVSRGSCESQIEATSLHDQLGQGESTGPAARLFRLIASAACRSSITFCDG